MGNIRGTNQQKQQQHQPKQQQQDHVIQKGGGQPEQPCGPSLCGSLLPGDDLVSQGGYKGERGQQQRRE